MKLDFDFDGGLLSLTKDYSNKAIEEIEKIELTDHNLKFLTYDLKFEIDTIGRLFDKFDVFEKDFYQYIFNNDKGNNKTKINKEKSSPEKKQGVIF